MTINTQLDGRIRWRGKRTAGERYFPNDLAHENGWAAVANKLTEDPIEPTLTGSPVWVSGLGDTPAWVASQTTANAILTGQRYTLNQGYFLRGARIWVPYNPDITIQVNAVIDPTGPNPDAGILVPEFTPDAGDDDTWRAWPLGLTLIPAGTTFDLFMILRSTTGETSWSADWDYKRQDGDPSDGEINHQSGGTQMRIAHVDKDDNDQQAQLEALNVGDKIAAGGVTWNILGIDQQASHVGFTVEPNSRAQENLYTVQFTTYGSMPIDFDKITGHYTSYPSGTVQGIFTDASYPDDLQLSSDAFGVDVQLQEAVVSDDWDYLPIAGSGAAGTISASAFFATAEGAAVIRDLIRKHWQWQWRYNGTDSGDPGNRNVKIATGDDWLYVAHTSFHPLVDQSPCLLELRAGDSILIWDSGDADAYREYEVTGDPTNYADHIEIPVELKSANHSFSMGDHVQIGANVIL